MDRRRFIATAGAGLLTAAAHPRPASAQAKYPSRTIEIVVPFAPGGGTDNLMRTIVAIIDENRWSPVAFNVNNRAGGRGSAHCDSPRKNRRLTISSYSGGICALRIASSKD